MYKRSSPPRHCCERSERLPIPVAVRRPRFAAMLKSIGQKYTPSRYKSGVTGALTPKPGTLSRGNDRQRRYTTRTRLMGLVRLYRLHAQHGDIIPYFRLLVNAILMKLRKVWLYLR